MERPAADHEPWRRRDSVARSGRDSYRRVPFCRGPAPISTDGDHVITRLLEQARSGDDAAFDRILRVVYAELRTIAARHMRGERPDHTLQPTALVHEAFLRLLGGHEPAFDDRAHLLRAASQAMRHVLVDHARARGAAKRSGAMRVTLDESLQIDSNASPRQMIELLELDDALERLAAAEPRWARVVEMRIFAGLDVSSTARALGVSEPTVKRDWAFAKAWLARELGDA